MGSPSRCQMQYDETQKQLDRL
ncbi:unnamed protein product, partial [Rotaria sp. Silwood1]